MRRERDRREWGDRDRREWGQRYRREWEERLSDRNIGRIGEKEK